MASTTCEQTTAHLPFNINKKLGKLYVSFAIRNFALGLIVIFEPIYIYLFLEKSLPQVFVYFGILFLLTGILFPLGGKAVSYFGIRQAIILSVPFTAIYYVGLWQIDKLGSYAYFLVVPAALSTILYWVAFHICFSQFSDSKKRGRQISHIAIVSSLASSAAPFLGGFLIIQFGFAVLFIVVFGLLFLSAMPLMLTGDVRARYHDSFFTTFREVFYKKYRYKTLAFLGEGGNKVAGDLIWPLYLFILAISFKELGLVVSGVLMVSIAFIYLMGRLTDRYGADKVLKFGVILSSIFWPVRALTHTPLDAFFIQSTHSFGQMMTSVPFLTIFYNWTSQDEATRGRFIVFRDLILNCSAGILLFVYALVFSFIALQWAFVIAAFFSALLVFATRGGTSLHKKTAH